MADKDPREYRVEPGRTAPGLMEGERFERISPAGDKEASETEEAIASHGVTSTPGPEGEGLFEERAHGGAADDRSQEAVPGIGGAPPPREYGETPPIHARRPLATGERMPEVGRPPIPRGEPEEGGRAGTGRTDRDRPSDPNQRHALKPDQDE